MNLELLADNFEAHKIVAKWYFDEWVSAIPGATIDRVENKISKAINRDSAPLIVLAKKGEQIIGAAELKVREMDIYPECEYWLGGVYVEKFSRGKGIGTILTLEVIRRAKKAEIANLYLQTENLNGGLYASCGFKPIEKVDYKGRRVLVMKVELNA